MLTYYSPSLILVLCVISSFGVDGKVPRVRYQNWVHESQHEPLCRAAECDISTVGEVSLSEIDRCLANSRGSCTFSVEAVHTHSANYRDDLNFLCWAPTKGVAGVNGINLPDFFPERDYLEYTDRINGQIQLEFIGLGLKQGETCALRLVNQDVRMEQGCGWEDRNQYSELIPAEPYYTFTPGERRLVIEGSDLRSLLHSVEGPGLFLVWDRAGCSRPISRYSYSFTTRYKVRGDPASAGSHLGTFSYLLLFLSTFLLYSTL